VSQFLVAGMTYEQPAKQSPPARSRKRDSTPPRRYLPERDYLIHSTFLTSFQPQPPSSSGLPVQRTASDTAL
jgi:hypothetical protein